MTEQPDPCKLGYGAAPHRSPVSTDSPSQVLWRRCLQTTAKGTSPFGNPWPECQGISQGGMTEAKPVVISTPLVYTFRMHFPIVYNSTRIPV